MQLVASIKVPARCTSAAIQYNAAWLTVIATKGCRDASAPTYSVSQKK